MASSASASASASAGLLRLGLFDGPMRSVDQSRKVPVWIERAE
jgi:hypothetical protein